VQTNLWSCFLGRCPISQVFPSNSPWACQTYADKMMVGKTAPKHSKHKCLFFTPTGKPGKSAFLTPKLWSTLHLGTDSALSDGTHTDCFHGQPTTAKFTKFYSQTCGHGEKRHQPTLCRPRRALQGSTALHWLQRPVFSPNWDATKHCESL
jgi:hypothetical protein